MTKGFVYVLGNAALSGLVKIGFTTKVPDVRAAELASTGIPAPFVVEYYCLCEDADSLEVNVHAALAHARYNNDREFFAASIEDAISTIELAAPHREHTWRKQSPLPSAHLELLDPSAKPRPARVECAMCGAYYISATYCPKCQVKLIW